MGNEDSFDIPHREAVYGMSEADWLLAAWNCACSGIVQGRMHVTGCQNGVWSISCENLTVAAGLLDNTTVIERIKRLGMIRPLPMIVSIRPVLPKTATSPTELLSQIPLSQMPERMWHQLAWQMSVDEETAKTTTILAIHNGTWRIRCDSQHAWDFLKSPLPVMQKLSWFSRLRPLCEVRRFELLLGKV